MKSSISLLLVLASLNVSAGVQRKVVKNKTLVNKDCEATDSCTLKSLSLKVSDYIVTRQSEKSYGSNAYIAYETEDVKHLEDYAIVQFIKGCAYNEKLNEDGTTEVHTGVSRKFFGSYSKFIHKEWVIDSIDKDPIYNSSEVSDSRHEYYRWNENPNSYSDNGEHYVLRRYPTHPKLYVSDLPSTSFYSDSVAKNTNLIFKTCVYKTKDIPRELNPTDINFADPLLCMNWESKNVYNFKTKKYEKNRSVEETCNEL